MMKFSLLISGKVLLTFCNFLLLSCGSILITGGFLLLCDTPRILLSRLIIPGPTSLSDVLPHPFFYYFSLGVICMGFVLCFAGVLGCWAACIDSYCVLTFYFILVLIVLIAECGLYTAVSVWPHCLGLTITQEELTKTLQRQYAVAGQEQFTAAVDLAQAEFKCCGISTAIEYDTSLWRLQALGHPSLAVPLSCCRLANFNDPMSYLNPQPLNKSLCQALETEYQQGFRHIEGCMPQLELWYQEQYILFLAVGLVIVLIEFCVLLSTILSCTKVHKHKKRNGESSKNKSTVESNKLDGNTHQRTSFAYSNDAYTMSNSFRQNYKLVDK